MEERRTERDDLEAEFPHLSLRSAREESMMDSYWLIPSSDQTVFVLVLGMIGATSKSS